MPKITAEAAVPADRTTEIGERLRMQRSAAGLSQTDLAERLGIKQTYISNIETGLKRPKLAFLTRAAREIGCDVTALAPESAAGSGGGMVALVASIAPDIWVARSVEDRIGLGRLGFRIGVRAADLPALLTAARSARAALAIRADQPPAPLIPNREMSDGIDQEYRHRLYAWAASVAGDRFSEGAREVFWRVVVDGDSPAQVAQAMGRTIRSVRVQESEVRIAYHAAIESPEGVRFATMLLEELVRPIPVADDGPKAPRAAEPLTPKPAPKAKAKAEPKTKAPGARAKAR